MVILSSPSGAGKTTLVKLLSQNKNFHISVSHTTRKPRLNEIADKDYYFVDHDKFENLIKNEEFLEYARVFNHLYGTTRTPVIEKLEKSENVIFDIDWQGADQIKNKNLDAIVLNSLNDKGAGFGHDTNKVSIINKNGLFKKFKLKSKSDVSIDIFNELINDFHEKY